MYHNRSNFREVSPHRPAIVQLLHIAEKVLFLVCMVILTGAPIDFLVKTAGIAPTEGLGIFWVPLLMMAGIAILLQPVELIKTSVKAFPVLLVAGAILLSVTGSFDKGLSIKEAVFFLAQMLAAFYVVRRFSLQEILDVFALMFAGLALLSIVLALGMPRIGVMQDLHAGAWNGPWIDKNTLGRFFGLSLAIALARGCVTPASWFSSLPLALVSFGLVLMSTSKTALLGAMLGVLLVLAVFIMRRGPVVAMIFTWLGTLMTAGLVALVLVSPALLFGLLQRDATLTSRTKIWTEAERLIEQRPTRGYGYGAVWTAKSASAPVVQVHQRLQFEPVNAHSSWVDARLETGKPGLVTLALMALFAFVMACLSIPWSKSAYWTVPSLVILLQTSLAESVLLGSHATESFLFIMLSAMAACAMSDRTSFRQSSPAPVPRPPLTAQDAYPQPAIAGQMSAYSPQLSQRLNRLMYPVNSRSLS